MTFNKTNIKKYKGGRVRIKYSTKGVPRILNGVIVYNLTENLILKVNNETEAPIRYDSIESIEKIKSFASYVRKINSLIDLEDYDKALEQLNYIKDLFRLDDQVKEISKLIENIKN